VIVWTEGAKAEPVVLMTVGVLMTDDAMDASYCQPVFRSLPDSLTRQATHRARPSLFILSVMTTPSSDQSQAIEPPS
jgi:hypothetical protein